MKVNKRKEKKDPRGGPTLATVWTKLSRTDRAMLCSSIYEHGELKYDVHQGVLPFIPLAVAVKSLRNTLASTSVQRGIFVKLLGKLNTKSVDVSNMQSFKLTLRHRNIVHRFGVNYKCGLRIPFAAPMLVTAGLRWSLPHRAYIPDKEAKVYPMFNLKHLSRIDKEWSCYSITCPSFHKVALHDWLVEYCCR